MNPRLVFKAALVCLLLVLLAEGVLTLAKRHAPFFRLFQNQIVSCEILDDLAACSLKSGRPLIVVMGDSVVYGSDLHAHGVPHWREQALAAGLQRQLPQATVLDLSLDGALPGDYLGLYAAARRLKPDWIIFEYNYRMFSQKFGSPSEAVSRPWLRGLMSQPLFPALPQTAGDKIKSVLRKVSQLYRYAEAFRDAFFFPSREEVINRLLAQVLPSRSLRDPGDREMLLKLKIKPHYYTPLLTPEHAGLQAVQLLENELRRDQQPHLAFFTPQNQEYITEIADPHTWPRNLAILDSILGSLADQKRFFYWNWGALYPADAFYDHCHLVPRYNETFAKMLAGIIADGGRRDHVQRLE
ncbi:MAG: SGNH/GDSL hydrolase family protein [Candidatus Firestonebacteria bacterium]|nr:SGNH/GDSL hydrolase family protein [Candidatus Firestonebacteria bacterium]